MKQFFYGSLIFLLLLVVGMVITISSSFVIKKVADKFAPAYHISYQDITGNMLTGIKISGLAYEGKKISKEIRFAWNPSKLLYQEIAINEIGAEEIEVETLKALLASFPSSEDNTTSTSFPFVVSVDKVHLSLSSFVEEGVFVKRVDLNAKEIFYASDEVSVGNLQCNVETNVTNIKLHATLKEGKITVKNLSLEEIDTQRLETIFLAHSSTSQKSEAKNSAKEKENAPNPLIPQRVKVVHFSATLKPRSYQDAQIHRLKLTIDDLNADLMKVIKNRQNAFSVGNCVLVLKSDRGEAEIVGMLKENTVTLKKVNFAKIDAMALKAMFAPKSDESNRTKIENTHSISQHSSEKKKNNLIPQTLIVQSLHTDILPATIHPVQIDTFRFNAEAVKVNLETLVVKKGKIDLNATTNLTNIFEKGEIVNNQLQGHIILTPNQPLFKLYELPLRKEAIGDVEVHFTASQEKIKIELDAKAKHILLTQTKQREADGNATKPFTVDINHLKLTMLYLLEQKHLKADANVQVTTPYAKDITLRSNFSMFEGSMNYQGKLNVKKVQLEGIGKRQLQPINHLEIAFKGDEKQIQTKIDSLGLKGYLNISDFKKEGKFHLATKKPLEVGKLFTLPIELNATRANVVIDIPLHFAKLLPIKGTLSLRSNLANVNADVIYGKRVLLKTVTSVPQNSLLRTLDKNIHWNALSPLTSEVKFGEKEITASLNSSKLTADMLMKPLEGTVSGKIRLAGLMTTLKGDKNGEIVIHSDVGSFKTLLKTVNAFYTVKDLPKVEGKLSLSVTINKKQEASLQLSSPQVIYHADRTTVHTVDDVKVLLRKRGDQIELSNYQLSYNKMKFFAQKPSIVAFDKENVIVSAFWLNDELKISGIVDTKRMKGELLAEANRFHFSNKMIDLESKINIRTTLNGAKTDINGKITLLGGNIYYNLGTKSFPSDSDILIVQEMKKKEANSFMDMLSMNIIVNSEKPLIYKQGDIDMKAYADLKIIKAVHSEPLVLGELHLPKGGTYEFQGKRFVVKRGDIYFVGNPNKPLLDIEVNYQAENYLITISVSGTPALPVINFSSKPSLTREQILSVILFDSEEGAGSNSSEDMMKMMGGAMAKSALANAGVKIDYLSIGTDGSMEIGKKITDKMTVIYGNGEIPSITVKYRHSPRTESVFKFDEISQSYDIVYRRDMSSDDIVIFGRGKRK